MFTKVIHTVPTMHVLDSYEGVVFNILLLYYDPKKLCESCRKGVIVLSHGKREIINCLLFFHRSVWQVPVRNQKAEFEQVLPQRLWYVYRPCITNSVRIHLDK